VAYAAYRFVETGIGIAAAYLAALVWEFGPQAVRWRPRRR
jgi:hypothetical protein